MGEINEFLKRVIDRMHLKREMYSERQVPENLANVRVIPFFGDIKAEFVFSSLLSHRLFLNDYVVVCSWPGHSGIYSGIKEFWYPEDESLLSDLARNNISFYNNKMSVFEKSLLRYFDSVTLPGDFFAEYYQKGLTSKFFTELKEIQYSLPAIPSTKLTWERGESNQKYNLIIKPSKYIQRWMVGKEDKLLTESRFWEGLIDVILKRGYQPLVIQDYSTHDMMSNFAGQCFYITERNLLAILAVMRSSDCVVDIFNGLSRYAMMARCPYFVCDERQRYFQSGDYILDDLCGSGIPKSYLFSFAPLLSGGESKLLANAIINKLEDFLPTLDRNNWPSTTQKNIILNYDGVRSRQIKSIGTRFIKASLYE